MQQLGPFLFNGFRFLIGAITLIPVMLLRKDPKWSGSSDWGSAILIGIIAGKFLFFGAPFQQLGLVFTTAGKAGFITGLYIIILPLMGMIWGDKTSLNTWVGGILFSLELVFAAFWGWLFLKELLSPRALLGSGLMLAGMILSQIRFGSRTKII